MSSVPHPKRDFEEVNLAQPDNRFYALVALVLKPKTPKVVQVPNKPVVYYSTKQTLIVSNGQEQSVIKYLAKTWNPLLWGESVHSTLSIHNF